MTDRRPTLLSTLRHRDFTLLWSGQALSAAGNRMFPVILAFVVLDRAGGANGATTLGLVLAAQSLALTAGTLAAAAVADRWPRVPVMVGTDVARAACVAVIAITPERMPIWALIVAVALSGAAEGLFLPAYDSILPRVLPQSHLQPGNALTSLAQYTALIVGPSLAGGVVALIGTGAALWTDVATFGISVATLLLIRETGPGEDEEESQGPLRDFVAGLRAVRDRPWVAASIGMSTIVMAFVMAPVLVAAPVEAERRLGGAGAYGLLVTALGVGSIAGSMLAGRIRTTRPGVVAVAGVFAMLGPIVSLWLLPLAGALAGWALAGVGLTVFQVLWMTAVQRDVPDNLLGRVMALDWLGSDGLTPVGYLLAGLAVTAVGSGPVLLTAGLLLIVTAPLPLLVRGGAAFSTLDAGAPRRPRLAEVPSEQ